MSIGHPTITDSAVDIERIIADIDGCGSKLPVDSILAARQHRDLIVPRLIRVIAEATAVARTGVVLPGHAPFLALFLLAEFRAAEALPVILDTFSLPGELADDLYGSVIPDGVPRIVISLAPDPAAILEELADNTGRDLYIRWGAAAGYEYLVRDGVLTREETVRRLARLLRTACDREDEEFVAPLISILCRLAPREASGEIERAFENDLVDESIVDRRHFERS